MTDNQARLAGMKAVSDVAKTTLAKLAKKEHLAVVEMSHTARIALDRLTAAAVEQGLGKSEISLEDLNAVKEALRTIQNSGHLAFLRDHGSEEDYQAIGKKVDKVHKPQRRRRT